MAQSSSQAREVPFSYFSFSLQDLGFLIDSDTLPQELKDLFWINTTAAFLSTNIRDSRQVAAWIWNAADMYFMFSGVFVGCGECNQAFMSELTEVINLEQVKLYALLAAKRVENGWLLSMIQRFLTPRPRERGLLDRLLGRR